MQERIAHLERLGGQQALVLDLLWSTIHALKKPGTTAIHERHAIIERLREHMQQFSVRKLCRSLGINRQWYNQHRRSSAYQEGDERLRHALQENRVAF